jgi:putative ABC transport system ATP-binding protein
MNIAPTIRLDRVSRTYSTGRLEVHALQDADLAVQAGEFVAIVGPSGSGKSTMMNILGCLDRPTAGRYELAGTDVDELSDDGLARLRSREIGFVFQSYNLLPRTSALENVAAPLLYQGVGGKERRRRAREALERLGLADRLDHEPSELSGGQQQRVAVARALVTDPALILADEPTGNLDEEMADEILDVIDDIWQRGTTVLLATHQAALADQLKRRTLTMRQGRLVKDEG